MGAFGEAFGEFARPLLEQTDGSQEQAEKALQISLLCYNAAILPDDQREDMLAQMRPAFEMDDAEFDDFRRSIVDPMIARHKEMFPLLHQRRPAPATAERRPPSWLAAKRDEAEPVTAAPARKATVDRYAVCSCGSGKKYKFCCGAKG